jgi:hypothetical protein
MRTHNNEVRQATQTIDGYMVEENKHPSPPKKKKRGNGNPNAKANHTNSSTAPQEPQKPVQQKPRTQQRNVQQKRNTKQRPQNTQPQVEKNTPNNPTPPAEPQTSTPRNISADEWKLTELTYNEDGTENPPELILSRDGRPLARFTVNEANTGQLLREMQIRLEGNSLIPTDWNVQPNDDGEPVLTFSTKTRILTALPMNQRFLKQIVKTLEAYILVPEKPRTLAQRWWQRHKVARVFVTLLVLPLGITLLIALGWGFTHSY